MSKSLPYQVVVKIIIKSRVPKDSWVFDQMLNEVLPMEIFILASFDHPNIVKAIEWYENAEFFQVVMEEHGKGVDLDKFIELNPHVNEATSSYIFRQIVSAVSYLHSLGVRHADIKPSNVIINEELEVKLIDFGLAIPMVEGQLFFRGRGHRSFACPESLREQGYQGPASEVFALGVTLFMLVLRRHPFAHCVRRMARGQYIIDKDISQSLCDLIKHMLEPDPARRYTLPEVESHPWVQMPVMLTDD